MDVFCFELSKLFVNSSATDIVLVILSSTAVETAIAQCTSHWAMATGHHLNTSIVLAAAHGLSGLFRAVSAVEPSLCRSLPTLPPSLIGHLASVDVKQHESKGTDCGVTPTARHRSRLGTKGANSLCRGNELCASISTNGMREHLKQNACYSWAVCTNQKAVCSFNSLMGFVSIHVSHRPPKR